MVQETATHDREVESPEEAEEASKRRSPSGRVVYDGPPDGLTDADLKTIYGGESWME